MNPGETLGGQGTNAAESKDRKLQLGVRELIAMSSTIEGYSAGENGASLEEVIRHSMNERPGYGLVDDTFLSDLHADNTKIDDLMARLGETREEVGIVARAADGSYTRMLLKKDDNGHYRETKEGVESSDKTKTHRRDSDLFIFEKGLSSQVA